MIARAVFGTIRRPGALGLVWLTRLGFAWLVAGPVARALVAFGVLNHPRGDAVLFDAGGVWLAEAVRASLKAGAVEFRGAVVTGATLAWLGLIPLAGLMVALRERPKHPLGLCLARAVAVFPRFTLLAGATLFVQSVLGLGCLLASVVVHRRLPTSLSEPKADLLALGVLAIGLLASLWIGIVEDLARAAVVNHDAGILSAIRHAFSSLAKRPFALIGSWSLFALIGWGVVLGAAFVTGVLDVSRSADIRVFAALLIHQTAAFACVATRAFWLSIALSEPSPTSDDKSEDSVAPVDPSPHPAA